MTMNLTEAVHLFCKDDQHIQGAILQEMKPTAWEKPRRGVTVEGCLGSALLVSGPILEAQLCIPQVWKKSLISFYFWFSLQV